MVGRTLKLEENESLKWFKQLAARGHIREISDKGEAGEMEIYTDTDLLWLIQNQERAFPGSPRMEFIGNNSGNSTDGGLRIVLYLAYHKTGICNYKDLTKAAGYKNKDQLSRVLKKDEIDGAIRYLEWEPVNKSQVPGYNGSGNKLLINWAIYKS